MLGPKASWWWSYKPVRTWGSSSAGAAPVGIEFCGWSMEKGESLWAGSLPGLDKVAGKNRCCHCKGEHGRVPGAKPGRTPTPLPLYREKVKLLKEWYSTGRVVPENAKPLAWSRTPWETAVGELVEVIQFKPVLKWNDQSKVHINRLELRGRNKVVRRYSRRKEKHHRRILTTGDSRVMTGCVAKGRSPADGMNDDLKNQCLQFITGEHPRLQKPYAISGHLEKEL